MNDFLDIQLLSDTGFQCGVGIKKNYCQLFLNGKKLMNLNNDNKTNLNFNRDRIFITSLKQIRSCTHKKLAASTLSSTLLHITSNP